MSKTLKQPSLAAAAPLASAQVAALVEYAYGVERWRCERFDLLVGEFGTLPPEQLGAFQLTCLALGARPWSLVRRLYGLVPVAPDATADPEDLRVWTRAELLATAGLTAPQLRAELDAVRATWESHRVQTPAPPPPPSEPAEELNLAEDPLLTEFGFELRMNSSERDWFVQRVRDFEKVLREKLVGGLARNALMTALRQRRLDHNLDATDAKLVGGKDWKSDLKLSQELAVSYNEQVEKIIELCPWASSIAGKQAFLGVISDITKAIAEFHAGGGTRLIDGIHTATEMQVLVRRSVQLPDPAYRAGQVMYRNAAKAGLFDPNWESPFTQSLLRKLDLAWKAAFVLADDKDGAVLPDLEADGEYEDLRMPGDRVSLTVSGSVSAG